MYHKILAALDHTAADDVLLPHLHSLAALTGAEIILVHVADGWAARNLEGLNLAESEEMKADREYLEKVVLRLRKEEGGIKVRARLALGDPRQEILKVAAEEECDLIAMTTHGHRFIEDVVRGSTIDYVRHRSQIPLLIVSAIGH